MSCQCLVTFMKADSSLKFLQQFYFSDKCGANMTGDRGKLRASTEPMTDCYYYIHKPNFRVFLTVTKFHFPSNVTNGTCDNSYIEIMVGRDMVR